MVDLYVMPAYSVNFSRPPIGPRTSGDLWRFGESHSWWQTREGCSRASFYASANAQSISSRRGSGLPEASGKIFILTTLRLPFRHYIMAQPEAFSGRSRARLGFWLSLFQGGVTWKGSSLKA